MTSGKDESSGGIIMLSTIIIKELKTIISSPKFVVTFAACTILILLSIWVGIQDYRTGIERLAGSHRIHTEVVRKITTWERIHTRAWREPDPMQIFVSGINNDIGRLSEIRAASPVKLTNSVYSDDSIFAVFRFVDFAFIVQMVLSLIAILFTYDAINGERESGTLQLTFSNPVPRARFILGKLIGSWLGLVIPLSIPLLLSVLLLLLMKIPMTSLHWEKLVALLVVSLLFFTFFIALGLLTSALTRRSSTSFMISLVAWVLFVFIIPRVSVMSAGQVINVPSIADLESKQAAFVKDYQETTIKKRMQPLQEKLMKKFATMTQAKATKEEMEAAQKKAQEEYQNEMLKVNNQLQKDIADHYVKLNEERRNQEFRLERLAFTISRLSPAAAYRLAAMNLAETDVEVKKRVEDAMISFRTMILQLGEKKTRERGGKLGMGRTSLSLGTEKNSDGTMTFSIKRTDTATIEATDIPSYVRQPLGFRDTLANTVVDIGALALFSVVAFVGTFVCFLRYDVR
jgi:ABC-type transport system involved in multi-copper enzyme maturation permease subunit